MKIKDFAGYIHNWPSMDYIPDKTDTRPRSSLHLKCREILEELYPTRQLFEEVPIPGTQMSFDFVLPHRKICIEVQGQQHFDNTSFFFNNKFEFAKAQGRDKLKRKWCEENGLRLIELLYNESEEKWINKIMDCFESMIQPIDIKQEDFNNLYVGNSAPYFKYKELNNE